MVVSRTRPLSPNTRGGSAEEESNVEAPLQRAMALVRARSMDSKEETAAPGASKKAPRLGLDPPL